MYTSIKLCLLLTFCMALSYAKADTLKNDMNDYMRLHLSIGEALNEGDLKRAKTLVKELIPLLESDIEYTEQLMNEEEDEHLLDLMSTRLNRQKEIKSIFDNFLKSKNIQHYLSSESTELIKELRRLSMKPKVR